MALVKLSLVLTLTLAACSSSHDPVDGDRSGTITSLAAPANGNAVYLAVAWAYDDGHGDTESGELCNNWS